MLSCRVHLLGASVLEPRSPCHMPALSQGFPKLQWGSSPASYICGPRCHFLGVRVIETNTFFLEVKTIFAETHILLVIPRFKKSHCQSQWFSRGKNLNSSLTWLTGPCMNDPALAGLPSILPCSYPLLPKSIGFTWQPHHTPAILVFLCLGYAFSTPPSLLLKAVLPSAPQGLRVLSGTLVFRNTWSRVSFLLCYNSIYCPMLSLFVSIYVYDKAQNS